MANRLVEAGHAAGYDSFQRMAFFTDTSICIGCKACEVACKEWNRNPVEGYGVTGNSYDNTGSLGANTWRHVAFVEQNEQRITQAREEGRQLVALGLPSVGAPGVWAPSVGKPGDETPGDGAPTIPDTDDFRWLMSSDVCKHCTNAGCLDVCPTGALFRTEYGTVVVQDDVCNGCGTCVAGCPFGVIERRDDGGVSLKTDKTATVEHQDNSHAGVNVLAKLKQLRPQGPDHTPGKAMPIKNLGVAQKCTMCYDRLKGGEQPACAKTCPTTSIKFGTYEAMLAEAKARVAQLHEQGLSEARLYGANPADGVGGTGSIFLLLDAPEVYGLPPDPRVPTEDLPKMFKTACKAVAGFTAVVAASFALGGH
ncbi:4Fe-4S dicluster domain-containing protein [Corynebacterium lizhenjunii]|uniref:4Fe-4S dicluster domain-containing protein n=1 Tax=Corynebacterium lizhenjunii TaxID=2709394 RepID=A0A7T0PCN3_9CORY|nr:4Fe-4S dicluster domain-containing protein [Corynebacterium lizhenjunii]QPK79902.1 4Fe-4S dicluster domain-containing protein [Corynebacterium lizhenjunii]